MKRFVAKLALTLLPQTLALVATGPLLAQSDLTTNPPMGRMISFDGRNIHLYCTGVGKPTVILEEGRGGIAVYWAWVQRNISKATRVCSYDRPGYGWSDPDETPMDAAHVSGELHALLRAANEKAPYILVGHSLGGPYARMFAAQYRNEVVGLVLVDATHPSHIAARAEVGLPSPDQVSPVANFLASSGMLPMAMKFGIAKTSYDKSWNDLPADVVPAVKVLKAGPQPVKTWLKETESIGDTLSQISALSGLRDLPVTVISSDKWIDADVQIAEQRADWNKRQQRNWLTISTNSSFLIIPGADHVSLLSNKDHAGAVAKAVVKMIQQIRHH